MLGLGVKPNATSYTLLVDAHLINRDQKAAISVLNNMITAGFEPSRETLKKVRRRCIREMDYESEDLQQSLARQYNIRLAIAGTHCLIFSMAHNIPRRFAYGFG